MCLIVDEEQDFIVSYRQLEPSADGNFSLLDTVLDAIKTHKVLPEEIHIADKSIADFIELTLNALDIGAVENPYLDGVYLERYQSLKSFLTNGHIDPSAPELKNNALR